MVLGQLCNHLEKVVKLTPYRRKNSKWINRSTISMQKEGEKEGVGVEEEEKRGGAKEEEMVQVSQENMNECPFNLNVEEGFLTMIQNPKSIKEKINNCDCIEFLRFMHREKPPKTKSKDN